MAAACPLQINPTFRRDFVADFLLLAHDLRVRNREALPMLAVLSTAGPVTPIIEAAATAIGAGIVVGGFLGASAGALNGRSRAQVEGDALRDSYYGGAGALMAWMVDQCIVYATSV